MSSRRKSFWYDFIEDAVQNPPFYASAEITGIENGGLSVEYTDKRGVLQTITVKVEDTAEYGVGDLLDIQICKGRYPAVFIFPRKKVLYVARTADKNGITLQKERR